MVKTMSQSRKEYKRAYQWLRWTKGSTHLKQFRGISQRNLYLAVLSYDYHDSEFSGWINRQRLSAFQKRCEQIANWRGWIPF